MATQKTRFEIIAEIGGLLSSLAQAEGAIKKTFAPGSVGAIRQEIDKLTAEMEELGDVEAIRKKQNEIAGLSKQLNGLLGEINSSQPKPDSLFGSIFKGTLVSNLVIKGLETVKTAIGSVADAMIGGNAQMEQYQTSFEVMIGSTEEAQKHLDDLKKFGAETPFEFPGLAKNSTLLQSFGIAADEVLPTLRMLGDVAQGDQQKLDGLALVFAQVSSAGKLQGQDLLQMINQGFNPLQVIAEKTGQSMASLKAQMEKGQISFDMVKQSFADATGEGGKFHGMMDKQSKTFEGLKSTLQDTLGEIGRTVGKPLFDAAKEGLIRVLDLLQSPELGLAIASVAKSIDALIDVFDSATGSAIRNNKAQLDLNSRMMDFTKEQIKAREGVKGLASEFEGLSKKQNRSSDENKRMESILKEINRVYPDVITSNKSFAGSLDEVRQAAGSTASEINALNEKLKVQQERQIQLQVTQAKLEVRKLEGDVATEAANFAFRITDSSVRRYGTVIGGFLDSINGSKTRIRDIQKEIVGGDEQRLDSIQKLADKLNEAGKVEEANVALGMIASVQKLALAKANLDTVEEQLRMQKKTAEQPPTPDAEKAKLKQKSILDSERRLAEAKLDEQRRAAITEAKERDATEIDLLKIEEAFAQKRLDLFKDFTARRLTEERKANAEKVAAAKKEDQAQVAHDVAAAEKALQKEIDADLLKLEGDLAQKQADVRLAIKKDALEKEKKEIERMKAFEERIEQMKDKAFWSNWEKRKELIEKEAEAFRKAQEDKRKAFEDHFAAPVADLGGQVFKSLFDQQMTGAERAKMVWEGLGNVALNVLGELAATFIKNQLMAVASTIGLIPVQAATAATTAALWSPAATLASLASFGANSVPAQAGIASTFALTKALSVIPMAEGGILNKPVFVAGEAGAEVVAPLKALPGLIREAMIGDGTNRLNPLRRRRKPEVIGGKVDVRFSTIDRAEFRRSRNQF